MGGVQLLSMKPRHRPAQAGERMLSLETVVLWDGFLLLILLLLPPSSSLLPPPLGCRGGLTSVRFWGLHASARPEPSRAIHASTPEHPLPRLRLQSLYVYRWLRPACL